MKAKETDCYSRRKRFTKKSILNLGGIAKGRKVGVGSEQEYTKKVASKKIATDQKAEKEPFKGVRKGR